jgi:catechol 2,3-dioxygenase-like lactoylglutathione lyase family enzyme
MKRRNFIRAAAGTTVAAGLGETTRSAPSAIANPPVMELRVALTTQAFDRLASFYRVGLGMEPAHVWPEDQGRALVLDMGKATLEVFDEKQAQTVDQIEVGRRVSGQIRFALRVPDLDAAVKRLQESGATLVHGPVVAPWGDKMARFQDPDGMQITIYQARDAGV